MGHDRVTAAIARIEAALARVEAAGRPPPEADSDGGGGEDVREAYRTLRGRVEEAVGQIDRLLATAERG